MNTRIHPHIPRIALVALLLSTFSTIHAQGTAFSYQGHLNDGANPATGNYDLKFSLFGVSSGGSGLIAPITNSPTAITNGLFTVTLDFGNSSFASGAGRWLEIAVRTNGAATFTNLTPRQQITAVPYAITASNLTGVLPTSQLSGTVGNSQLVNNSLTVNAGTGLSGGGVVALGGSTTLNNAGILSVTGNPDITASTVSGAVTLGDTANSTNIASTIVKRDTGGNFSAGTITLNTNLLLPATTATAGIIYSGTNTLLHTFGSQNVFAGSSAGNLTLSGPRNVGFGYQALFSNTSGNNNVACGYQTLSSNTIGFDNTANGYQALYNNINGIQNTASGALALFSDTSGFQNTAHGFESLFFNTTGIGNTAVGYQALYHNTSNSWNTAIGQGALFNYLDMSTNFVGNIAVGYQAGYGLYHGQNNIYIGGDVTTSSNEDNTIHIGQIQTKTYIAGIMGATVAGGFQVYITPSGQLGTFTSSARFKQNIQNMDDASKVLLSLRPVTFQYKPELDPHSIPQFGLVAEEVEKIDPDLVGRDDKNQIYTVRYEAVNAMLLNEFIKQHKKVEEQQKQIEANVAENAELKRRLDKLEQLMNPKTGDPK